MSDIYDGKPLPRGWLVFSTENGRPYFHNRVTASTQWEVPTDFGGLPVVKPGLVGAVFKEVETGGLSFDNTLDGSGGDGEITLTTRSNLDSARTVQLGGYYGSTMATGSKNKKGYTQISDDSNRKELDLEYAGHAAGFGTRDANDRESSGSWFFFLDVTRAQTFFNIDTTGVIQRIFSAVFPFKLKQLQLQGSTAATSSTEAPVDTNDIRAAPDFYGPFWIPTTLIVLLFALTNTASFFAGKLNQTNYTSLVVSFFTIYGYLLIVPSLSWMLILFLAETRHREAISLRQLVCVYGYSFAVGIPLALVSLLPFFMLRWLCGFTGCAISIFFILLNFRSDLVEADAHFKLALLVLIVLSQFTFYTLFPLYYFNV